MKKFDPKTKLEKDIEKLRERLKKKEKRLVSLCQKSEEEELIERFKVWLFADRYRLHPAKFNKLIKSNKSFSLL